MPDFLKLLDSLSGLSVKTDVRMREYTSFKIGGQAPVMVEPRSAAEVLKILSIARKCGLPIFIMGNGSNLLVSDEGVNAVVMRICGSMSGIKVDGTQVYAGSGVLLSSLAKQTVEAGLSGLEWAAGIPGTVGGAIAMNAGAYGGDIGSVVKRIDAVHGRRILAVKAAESDFGYRRSRFSPPEWIVCGSVLNLKRDDGMAAAKMAEYMDMRRKKQPLSYPSAGSAFKRPKGEYAGALIEKAGLKGETVGGARVSELHAGFIINTGGATSADVRSLIKIIQERVYDMSGIMLEPEIKFVGG